MSVSTTIPQRYIPIPQSYQANVSVLNASTQIQGRGVNETSVMSIALGGFNQDLSLILSIVILIITVGIILLYIITTTSIPRISGRSVEIFRDAQSGGGSGELYGGYNYQGVKLMLRKIYLSLRRSSGCITCTPRELALKGYAPEDFADIYEDTVYGGVERSNVDHIVERFKEILGGADG